MASYIGALRAAGAEVVQFEEFGSYQGNWYALVIYKGRTGWIKGSYGSCSYCDALDSEFDSQVNHEHSNNDYYNPFYNGFDLSCEECKKQSERYAAFGEKYLDYLMTQEEAEKKASENLEWDMNAQEMVDFVKKHSIGEK